MPTTLVDMTVGDVILWDVALGNVRSRGRAVPTTLTRCVAALEQVTCRFMTAASAVPHMLQKLVLVLVLQYIMY